jgi:beta-mannosidase
VEQAEKEIEVGAHAVLRFGVEELVGRFVDASWSYRFGPPAHDVIVASLEGGGGLLSQAFHFPAGPPAGQESSTALGMVGEAAVDEAGLGLTVRSARLAHGVRVAAEGFVPSDDAFSVEPGGERRLRLLPREPAAQPGPVTLTALNLEGRVRVDATSPDPAG